MVITISCPECHTSFPVDPDKIPERGVRVRCSACAHVFRVERPEPEPAAAGDVVGGTEAPGEPGVGLSAGAGVGALIAAGASHLDGAVEEIVATEAPVVDEPVFDEPVFDEPSVEEPATGEWSLDEPTTEEPVLEESVTTVEAQHTQHTVGEEDMGVVDTDAADAENQGVGVGVEDVTIEIETEGSDSWGADPDPYSLDGIEIAGIDDGSVLADPDEMPDWAAPREGQGAGSFGPLVDAEDAGGLDDAPATHEAVPDHEPMGVEVEEVQESGSETSVEATILEEAEPAAVEWDVPVEETEPTSVEPDWVVDQEPVAAEPDGHVEPEAPVVEPEQPAAGFEWPVVEPEPVAAESEWLVVEPTVEAPAPEPVAPPVHAFSFGKRDPMDKARRLARVLVSDMVMYNAERHQVALQRGTLAEDFEEEIDKSWKEFIDQVGPEIADGEGRTFWTQALNDILAKGKPLF